MYVYIYIYIYIYTCIYTHIFSQRAPAESAPPGERRGRPGPRRRATRMAGMYMFCLLAVIIIVHCFLGNNEFKTKVRDAGRRVVSRLETINMISHAGRCGCLHHPARSVR